MDFVWIGFDKEININKVCSFIKEKFNLKGCNVYDLAKYEDLENILKSLKIDTFMGKNVSTFKENDKIVLYGTGKQRRYFVGTFEIAGECIDVSNNKDGFYKYFNDGIKIKNIDIWSNPVSIKDVKDNLDFIKDKKNYGLHFRQTSKKLEEKDYQYLIEKSKDNR